MKFINYHSHRKSTFPVDSVLSQTCQGSAKQNLISSFECKHESRQITARWSFRVAYLIFRAWSLALETLSSCKSRPSGWRGRNGMPGFGLSKDVPAAELTGVIENVCKVVVLAAARFKPVAPPHACAERYVSHPARPCGCDRVYPPSTGVTAHCCLPDPSSYVKTNIKFQSSWKLLCYHILLSPLTLRLCWLRAARTRLQKLYLHERI